MLFHLLLLVGKAKRIVRACWTVWISPGLNIWYQHSTRERNETNKEQFFLCSLPIWCKTELVFNRLITKDNNLNWMIIYQYKECVVTQKHQHQQWQRQWKIPLSYEFLKETEILNSERDYYQLSERSSVLKDENTVFKNILK